MLTEVPAKEVVRLSAGLVGPLNPIGVMSVSLDGCLILMGYVTGRDTESGNSLP